MIEIETREGTEAALLLLFRGILLVSGCETQAYSQCNVHNV